MTPLVETPGPGRPRPRPQQGHPEVAPEGCRRNRGKIRLPRSAGGSTDRDPPAPPPRDPTSPWVSRGEEPPRNRRSVTLTDISPRVQSAPTCRAFPMGRAGFEPATDG